MLQFLKKEANITYTENGAATYASTTSHCLDLFATVGALRHQSDKEILDRFLFAYTENPDIAMKTLFFARDVRGGLGERRVFRVILNWLAANHPESVEKNMEYIAEYGRWDDLLSLLDTPCEDKAIKLIHRQLLADLESLGKNESVSLLAKWLPSVNASNPETVKKAKKIARGLGMNDSTYRKTLSTLREYIRIIENNLREKDYSFDYSAQPSKAMFKYKKAFLRNDGERYNSFLDSVAKGERTMHTGTLMPYEIIRPMLYRDFNQEDRKPLDVTWNAQEDFTNGENALVVIDGSGSMYWDTDPIPASVALSLGIYFAERNTGAFANHFITFSSNPRLVEIKGRDLFEKVQYCARFNEVANTNIQKVFALILSTAMKHKVPQEEMPSTLYIISDMEFDVCAEGVSVTNFEHLKKMYALYGYSLPKVVFWNVANRNRQQPVTMNEQGVALVSGCSPRIFSMVAEGKLSPYDYMMEILGSERYNKIAA